MESTENTVDVLNDLVKINNDRIQGYEKAIEDSSSDAQYHSMFTQMISESEKYKQQLVSKINELGGEADHGSTTNSGKIYRGWMDVKSTFQGKSGKSALELSEFGEDAAQKAYKEALDTDNLPADVRQLIMDQKMKLKESHDKIKMERDKAKANA